MTGVRQGFYRSSGHDSSMPGKWLPFDEIAGGWFNKTEYVQIPKGDLLGLHRYGTQGMKQISNALDDLQLPRGQEVELGADVNRILDRFNARITPSTKFRTGAQGQ